MPNHLTNTLLCLLYENELAGDAKALREEISTESVFLHTLLSFAQSHGFATQLDENKEVVNRKPGEIFVDLISDPKLLAEAINSGVIDFGRAIALYSEILEQKNKEGEDAVLSFITKIDTVANFNSIEKQNAQYWSQLPETFMQFLSQDRAEAVKWIVAFINLLNRMKIRDIDIVGGTYERLKGRFDELLKNHNMSKDRGVNKSVEGVNITASAVESEAARAEADFGEEPEEASNVRIKIR